MGSRITEQNAVMICVLGGNQAKRRVFGPSLLDGDCDIGHGL